MGYKQLIVWVCMSICLSLNGCRFHYLSDVCLLWDLVILTEAWPDEFAVDIIPEPAHMEDFRYFLVVFRHFTINLRTQHSTLRT